jgi:hypothetical protein
LDVQRDLDRLGAACRLRARYEHRGSWTKVVDGIATFEAALDHASKLLETAIEVGIFLDHPKYGGILVWTSRWPEGANRFENHDP